MKTAKLIQIICWTLVAVLLVGVLVFAITQRDNRSQMNFSFFRYWNWEDRFADEEGSQGSGRAYRGDSYSVPAADIKNINIDWVSGEINIIPYDGSEIVFAEVTNRSLNESDRLVYQVRGDTLHIKFWKDRIGINIGVFDQSKDLTVKVPKALAEALGELRVAAVSSDVISNHILVSAAEFETVSGKIRLEDFAAEELNMTTTSGRVEADGTFADVNIATVSGAIDLRDAVCPDSINIATVSGDATVWIPENDGFRVEFEKVSGDFESDFAMTSDKNGGTYKNGRASFKMGTVSGDLELKKITP